MENIQISAKTLGELAMPDFCPRCFWIQRNLKGGMPFSFFPGIFSSLDSYVKKIVHKAIDETGTVPEGMKAELQDVIDYLPALHHTKFRFVEPTTGITITGMVDDLLEKKDGKTVIIDYKLAKHSAGQDELLPMYEVQLNAYAMIETALGGNVDELKLIYCEPQTDVTDCTEDKYTQEGFEMCFNFKTVPICINQQKIVDLLNKAKDILQSATPPPRTCGCKDCAKLDKLLALAG